MTATISRWGNSLGLRIPKSALAEARLEEGDQVDVVTEGGRLIITRKPSRPRLTDLVAAITPENRHAETVDVLVGKEAW